MSSASSLGTTLTGLNTSGIQFSGLSSGLDTNKIIQGLLAIQQAQVTNLQNSQSHVSQEQTAFKTIDAKVIALQGQADRLASTFSSVFDARAVTSSSADLATGAASSSAAPGAYTFTVKNLAAAQEIATQGFAASTSSVTQGTLQVQVGSGATTTITIDGSNNTLQGLASAINNAGADVTAAVVNTGAAQPYELLLTSSKTGAANTIKITNNLAASGGAAVQPTFNTVVQAAADASLTVGTGAGALSVTSPSNTVDGVFNGLTLNLVAADGSKPVTLTVTNDTATGSTAIHDFVSSFNDLIDFVNTQSTYDQQTSTAGILLGNLDASTIQNQITDAITGVVAGVNRQANRLTAIGVTLNDQGKLDVNDAKLGNALSGKVAGVSSSDIRRLFALDGQSTNSGVQFVSAGNQTQTLSTPYQVVVTQAATHAGITATEALAASIVIGPTNNALTLTVDGKTSGTIALNQGTYTPQTLAQELQAEINGNASLTGTSVAVTVGATGKLVITSPTYGSASQVAIGTGTALTSLGFVGTESARGQNVAGSFLVNGVTEPATGNGQLLTGPTTNAHSAGLVVRVTLLASQVSPSPAANVTVTRGIASQLSQVLNRFVDPVNGLFQTLDQSFQSTETGIQKSIDEQNASIQAQQQSLMQQFAAMETLVAQLKTAGSSLASLLTTTSSLSSTAPATTPATSSTSTTPTGV